MPRLRKALLTPIDLEKLLREDPEAIEDGLKALEIPRREFGGLVALDSRGVPVVIFAGEGDDGQILNALRYYDSVLPEVAKICKGARPRLVLVAPRFEEELLSACRHLDVRVELKAYRAVSLPSGEVGIIVEGLEHRAYPSLANSDKARAFLRAFLGALNSKERFSNLLENVEGYISEVERLSSEMEKLLSLRSEGKVSEKAYLEVYNDIEKKFEELRKEKLEDFYEKKAEILRVVRESDEALRKVLSATEASLVMAAEYKPIKEPAPAPMPETAPAPSAAPELKVEERPAEEPSAEEAMFVLCPRCGARSERKASFCFRCGAKLNEKAPEVKVERPPKLEKRSIQDLTTKALKICPKCGRENLSIANYCYNCNTVLSKE
jgi:ribosomal protein L40E